MNIRRRHRPDRVEARPGHHEDRGDLAGRHRVGARGLGLPPDESFEAIIREYIRENPDAIKLPLPA